jgi:hypothetical protein
MYVILQEVWWIPHDKKNLKTSWKLKRKVSQSKKSNIALISLPLERVFTKADAERKLYCISNKYTRLERANKSFSVVILVLILSRARFGLPT